MGRAKADVFGFDELDKAFKKANQKLNDNGDALLLAMGRQVRKKVYARTAKKTGNLKKSWRCKTVKKYKNNTISVVRVQSDAPHAHLYEYGHELYRGGKTRRNGKKLGAVGLRLRGVKHSGRVEGKYVLRDTMEEARSAFETSAQKVIEEALSEVETD